MNPCSPAPENCFFAERGLDWEAFRDWVAKSHCREATRDLVNYARKYYQCLLNMNLQPLLGMSNCKRVHVMRALSNLAKFLGVYDDYRRLIRKYGLSWKPKTSDEYIIARLTKVRNPHEIFEWVKAVRLNVPKLKDFMELLAFSGMRLIEALNSYNLIIELAKQNKLNQYYNEKWEALEHFRFKEVFLRKSKKAFISFVPKDLVERIAFNEKIPSRHAVEKRVESVGLKVRFSDVREAHATLLTKYLRQPEIDFLHGRVSTNVFMQNYFNPALIGDLKERVFKAIREIQTLI